MKKWTAVFFTLLFLLNLTGCAGSQQRSDKTSLPMSEPSAETEAENTENRSDEPVSETGKTLVVYYSATGNTENAANYIAAEIGADVFVLEPVEPYSDEDLDYNDEESRVVYEHDHPEAREIELVTAAVDNWDTYTTVFIGYPIWWGIAAWPVNGFVSENNFTGKTVIPFATSASSDLGESGELLAELAGTGDWLEGKRFSSHVSEDDVRAWLMEEGFLE